MRGQCLQPLCRLPLHTARAAPRGREVVVMSPGGGGASGRVESASGLIAANNDLAASGCRLGAVAREGPVHALFWSTPCSHPWKKKAQYK